jgi:hypothetical protein
MVVEMYVLVLERVGGHDDFKGKARDRGGRHSEKERKKESKLESLGFRTWVGGKWNESPKFPFISRIPPSPIHVHVAYPFKRGIHALL